MNIKEALEYLLEHGPKYNREYGICDSLDDMCCNGDEAFVDVYKFVSKNSLDWEGYSGNRQFPIEGGFDAFCANTTTLWEGDQLIARQSLIRHLLTKV